MFEHISRSCGNMLTHRQHSRYEGFLWHRKITCYGRDIDYSADAHLQTVNERRREAGMPLYEVEPHKHHLYFSGLGWTTKAGRFVSENSKDLIFRCQHGCPVSFEVRVARWKYKELTLNNTKVDQTWPS